MMVEQQEKGFSVSLEGDKKVIYFAGKTTMYFLLNGYSLPTPLHHWEQLLNRI